MCSRAICLPLLAALLWGCETTEKSEEIDTADAMSNGVGEADAMVGSRVFVSSTVASGDSMAKATELCQALADRAELEGRFVAWTSVAARGAIEQVEGNGPWYRTDGVLAFPDKVSLSNPSLVPINRDEDANVIDSGLVYTGTKKDGSASDSDCEKWTSYYEDSNATVGSVDSTVGWSYSELAHCGVPRRFYCFQSQ